MITIRHTHEDGTLVEGSRRGDGVYEIVARHGFIYRKVPGIFIRGSRDHEAKRHLIDRAAKALRAAGHEVTVEIDDTWRPAAVREAARTERAEERAERLAERAGKAAGRATAAHAAADRIADGIPFGQPILVGHHSQRRAERDRDKIQAGTRKAIAESRYADELARRAAGVDATQAQRHNPRVVMRRIEKLEADLRRWQRSLPGARDGYRTRCENTIARLGEEIEHWKATLAEHEALGTFVAWSREYFLPGDEVYVLGRWLPVRRVNAKSVSVPGAYGNAMSGMGASWNETVPWDQVGGRRREGWQLDKPNGEPWPVELAVKVDRWRDLLAELRHPYPPVDNPGRLRRIYIKWAPRIHHGLDLAAADAEVTAFWPDKADVAGRRDLAAAYVELYDRLAKGETAAQLQATWTPSRNGNEWTLPEGEPVKVRVDLVSPGDVVKGVYSFSNDLFRDFCGTVASVSDVDNRRERGDWVTITLQDGTAREFQTHRWLAVYPADQPADVEPEATSESPPVASGSGVFEVGAMFDLEGV